VQSNLNTPTCWKKSNNVPYQLCDGLTGCNGSPNEFSSFAACCAAWNNTAGGKVLGDGVADIRCFLAPKRLPSPCFVSNNNPKNRQCTRQDSPMCLAGMGFATQVGDGSEAA
jgi:hypothetical protein